MNVKDDPLLHWHEGLAPGQRRRDGELTVGGVSAGELAETYGTPLLAIDFDVLDAAIAEFRAACEPHGVEIAYAGKALLLVALARHLVATPLSVDVCSIGELVTAERAGFPAERIALHGCGKTGEELAAVVAGRVGTTIVDNADELRRLADAAAGARPLPVVLRINTGIEAHTHAFVRTGGDKTKFGISPDGLDEPARILRSAPNLQFAGLHSHIGSQIYEGAAFVENARALVRVAAGLDRLGFVSERLIVGGGFGVQMDPGDGAGLNLKATIAGIASAVAEEAWATGVRVPRLGIEPGRALIAHAGTSVYRVVAVKRQFGRPFVVVDGSIADNPRPALYGAYHHPILASRESPATQQTVLCGRSCENDEIVVAPLPTDVQPDDLIAICTTGAYTYSMSSNYNRFVRPAVVAVQSGRHRPIAKRETIDDVLRNDCDV